MLNQLVPLAVVNLLRARTRLLMTTGGVLIGTAAVILLVAFTIGLQNAAEAGMGSNNSLTEIRVSAAPIDVNNQNAPQLNVDTVKKLSRVPGVLAVIPIINLQGAQIVVDPYTGYRPIVGIDPALLPYLGVTPQTGKLTLATGQAIAGSDTGKNFASASSPDQPFKPVNVDLLGSPVKLQLTQFGSQTPTTRQVDLKIVTQLRQGNSYDSMLIMPIKDVMALNEWITGVKFDPKTFHYDQITVRAQNRELTHPVAQAIQKLGYNADSMGELLDQLNSFFTTMRLMLGAIGLVALLVAASGVANTMMMATRERIKEIGLMKAIGATDQHILTIFLLEAGLIGLTGGLGGVGLSLLLQNLINQGIKTLPTNSGGASFIPLDLSKMTNPVVIPPNLALFAIALATLICVGAGLYPALWAARLSPVMALKQE